MPFAASRLEIDLREAFPHLGAAPITEAVLEVRTRAQMEWAEGRLLEELEELNADYPKVESLSESLTELRVGSPQFAPQGRRDYGWRGARVLTEDERQVAVFHRDFFSFSRLKPYIDWENFMSEALRLWRVHARLSGAAEIGRAGLRFINQITLPEAAAGDLADYLTSPPQRPQGVALPLAHFLHHETLAVPGHPYAINLVKTLQQGEPEEKPSLLVDVDVYTLEAAAASEEWLASRLAEMRWLKNKVFFGSVQPTLLREFE